MNINVSFLEIVACLGSLGGAMTMVISFLKYLGEKREAIKRSEKRLVTIEESIKRIGGLEKDFNKIGNIETSLGLISGKVEIMWSFQIRRGLSEVVERKFGRMNSPFTLDSQVMEHFAPLRDDLISFHEREGRFLKDGDALLRIEQIFGDAILRQVCVPFQLSHGACLLLALAVARQTPILELELLSQKLNFEHEHKAEQHDDLSGLSG